MNPAAATYLQLRPGHLHSYVGGDAINRIDPSGFDWIEIGTYWVPDCAPNTDCRVHVFVWVDGGDSGAGKAELAQGTRDKNAEIRMTPTNVSADASVTAILSRIINAFITDPTSTCAKWFTAGFYGSPNRTLYGTLSNYLSAGLSPYVGAGDIKAGGVNAETAPPGDSGYVIVVNRDGAFFKNKSAGNGERFETQLSGLHGGGEQAQVFILMHEMAHTLGMIHSGDAGTDATSTGNQKDNNDSVWDACNTVISLFSNQGVK